MIDMEGQESPPTLTKSSAAAIFIAYHPRCCGAGREAAERRLLHFRDEKPQFLRVCNDVDIYL
jgi:hypothetical protein